MSRADNCRTFLSFSSIDHSSLGETDLFVAYLDALFRDKTIPLKSLVNLKHELEHNKTITNPIPHRRVRNTLIIESSSNEVHFENIGDYLNSPNLEKTKLLSWLNQFLMAQNQMLEQKRQAAEETLVPYDKLVFYPIRKGSFYHKELYVESKTRIVEKDIEMSSTLITQKMWFDIMGENPAKNKSNLNNPIENITWWAAAEFANRLSIKHGYIPVYNFKNINFYGKRAEDGTLKSDAIKIEFNTPEMDPTKKMGYRLPTSDELIFVMTNRGTNFIFSDSYAWIASNAGGKTQPVAGLAPVIVDDHPFYDLNGNVQHLTHNVFLERSGIDGDKKSLAMLLEGTHINYGQPEAIGALHETMPCSWKSDLIGFRLVRELE